jgi:hypothetical protein
VGQRRQLGLADLGGEADDREVRAVDLEQSAGALADRALVVGAPGLVGGADLAQGRPRQRQDVGDPERAADLDQLAARHDHLAAAGQRRQRQHRRRGVVVDDARRLGAGQRAQERGGVGVAAAALAGARSYSRFDAPAATSTSAAIAAGASGARPRLVWRRRRWR